MSGRAFVDTNVLVYCFDEADPAKRDRALAIVGGTETGDDLVLSTQVLQEFYVTVRKLPTPLSAEAAEEAVRNLSRLPVVQVDTSMVLGAIAASRRYQLSLWDSLILEAASAGGCSRLLTEDLQDGFLFGTLRVENPFAR